MTIPATIVIEAQTRKVLTGSFAVNFPICPPMLVPTAVATNHRASICPLAPSGANFVVADRPVGERNSSAHVWRAGRS